jgi:hypothetical protein
MKTEWHGRVVFPTLNGTKSVLRLDFNVSLSSPLPSPFFYFLLHPPSFN